MFVPLGQALARPLAEAIGIDTVLIDTVLLATAAPIVASCAAGLATPSARVLRAAPPRLEPRPG